MLVVANRCNRPYGLSKCLPVNQSQRPRNEKMSAAEQRTILDPGFRRANRLEPEKSS
jgi:hypothetical protein